MKKIILTRVKQMIIEDIKKGLISSDVASYESLSDYVDPNMYFIDAGYDYQGTEEDHKILNILIDRVDNWLLIYNKLINRI